MVGKENRNQPISKENKCYIQYNGKIIKIPILKDLLFLKEKKFVKEALKGQKRLNLKKNDFLPKQEKNNYYGTDETNNSADTISSNTQQSSSLSRQEGKIKIIDNHFEVKVTKKSFKIKEMDGFVSITKEDYKFEYQNEKNSYFKEIVLKKESTLEKSL